MKSESALMRRIQLAATQLGARLLRNNVGLYYTKDGRPVRCGLAPGSGDLIGFVPVRITADMVGQTVAVFLSAEVKTGTGRLSPDQRAWLEMVNQHGGRAGVVRSEADLEKLVK